MVSYSLTQWNQKARGILNNKLSLFEMNTIMKPLGKKVHIFGEAHALD